MAEAADLAAEAELARCGLGLRDHVLHGFDGRLGAHEQQAAAAGGKDELKQAAKRARSIGKPAKAKAELEVPAEAQDMDADALRQRVAELTAENGRLRDTIAELQGALKRATAQA